MPRFLMICVSLLFAALPAHADVVQLTHGGQITGTILQQDRLGVNVKTPAGHVFNIPWSNVAGVTEGPVLPERHIEPPVAMPAPPSEALEPLSLSTQTGSTYAPTTAAYTYMPRLTTTRRAALGGWGGNHYAQTTQTANTAGGAVTAGGVETATEEDAKDFVDTGLWGAQWSGRVNAGASLQTGNTENNAIGVDATLKANWDDVHRASLKAEYNREEDDGDVTVDNRKLSGAYDYFFAEDWFLNIAGSLEQDDIDQIDLRSTIGAGLGHQVFKGEDLNLQYVIGPTYLRTEFENNNTEDSLAVRWAFDYDQFYWDKTFQGFHEHELLVPTDDTDAFLFDSKTGLRLPIRNGIVGTAEVDFEWDNAPAPGITEDDTIYSLKLGYAW